MKDRELVECDVCKAEFKMSDVKVQEEKLINDKTGMYFRCPECEQKYPFATITKKGKRLRNQLKRLVTRIQNTSTDKEDKLKKLVAQHEQMLKDYSKEVTGQYNESEVLNHE